MEKKIAKELLSINAVFLRPEQPLLGQVALKAQSIAITALF